MSALSVKLKIRDLKMIDASLRSVLNSVFPLIPQAPQIIVSGMPKSGTTAIAQLLAYSAGLTVSSDPVYQIDVNIGRAPRNALYDGTLTMARFWKKYQHFFKGELVKDPNFPFFIDDLLSMFPMAKQVYIVRDPRDNLRSILDRLSLNGKVSEEDEAYQKISGSWRNVLDGRKPELPGNGILEKMAWRWRVSTENYIKNQDVITLIQYEVFRKNKKAEIENLAQQLGLKGKNNISNKVDVQYQPKGKEVTDWEAYFGKTALEKINHIVGPCLSGFGYEK